MPAVVEFGRKGFISVFSPSASDVFGFKIINVIFFLPSES